MTPASPDPADLTHRLRLQLILAQVRIMELEDERDEQSTRLRQTADRLTEAQLLSDRKLDEAAHLERVRADLQSQYEHMRHIQHVTNEALNATRLELAAAQAAWRQAEAERAQSDGTAARLKAELQATEARVTALAGSLAARDASLANLQRELSGIKATRSWRWTAWLRRLGRRLGL